MDDPWGDHLADLVVHLKDADDSDLVFIDFCARSQRHYTAAGDGSHTAWTFNSNGPCTDSRLRLTTEFDGRPCWTDLTLEQERPSRAFKKGCSRNLWNVTYLGLRTVVLHKQPERAPAERRIPIHKSAWVTAELRLAAYCRGLSTPLTLK